MCTPICVSIHRLSTGLTSFHRMARYNIKSLIFLLSSSHLVRDDTSSQHTVAPEHRGGSRSHHRRRISLPLHPGAWATPHLSHDTNAALTALGGRVHAAARPGRTPQGPRG